MKTILIILITVMWLTSYKMMIVITKASNGQYNNSFGISSINKSNNNKIIILLNYCYNFINI
jgi:hypothetical protein